MQVLGCLQTGEKANASCACKHSGPADCTCCIGRRLTGVTLYNSHGILPRLVSRAQVLFWKALHKTENKIRNPRCSARKCSRAHAGLSYLIRERLARVDLLLLTPWGDTRSAAWFISPAGPQRPSSLDPPTIFLGLGALSCGIAIMSRVVHK